MNLVSGWVVGGLEAAFAWYGGQVACHPRKVVAGCLLATGLASLGLLNYRTENNVFRLWLPDTSAFLTNYNWLEEHSPQDVRSAGIQFINIGFLVAIFFGKSK